MGAHQTRNVLHSKDNSYKMKRQCTEWETIFANYNRFIFNFYKELIKLNINPSPSNKQTSKQNITRDIEIKKKTESNKKGRDEG